MRRYGALLAIALGGTLATAADASALQRTITVSGTGIVTTVPNQAQFSFGVATNANTAQAAIAANDARMNAVIAALEKAGLRARDLQTAEISLTPNTNANGDRIVNYSASNQVTATTLSIARSGSIIDAAVGAGANLASGPTLTESDQLQLEREALKAGGRRCARPRRGGRRGSRCHPRGGRDGDRGVELDTGATPVRLRCRGAKSHAGGGRDTADRGGRHGHLRDLLTENARRWSALCARRRCRACARVPASC